MKQLILNSAGNAAYALVFDSTTTSLFFRTDPSNTTQTTPNWAFTVNADPRAIMFGSNENQILTLTGK